MVICYKKLRHLETFSITVSAQGWELLSYLKLYSHYLAQLLSTEMLNSILELIHGHNLIPKTLLL